MWTNQYDGPAKSCGLLISDPRGRAGGIVTFRTTDVNLCCAPSDALCLGWWSSLRAVLPSH